MAKKEYDNQIGPFINMVGIGIDLCGRCAERHHFSRDCNNS